MRGAASLSAAAGSGSVSRRLTSTIDGAHLIQSKPPYWLPRHVFICLCGNHIILLDLKKDRYMALDAAHASPLAKVVGGWPTRIAPTADSAASSSRCATSIVRVMIDRGLLTPDHVLGKDAAPVTVVPPSVTLVQSSSLIGSESEIRLPIRTHHVTRFLLAAVIASARLRWRSLESVVGDVICRRIKQAESSDDCNMEAARELVAIFHWLRPFVFTAKNACLFDSLALLNFLSRYGLFPRWVFGVRTAPFAAHCWIQEGDTVFSDTAEHVSLYTPIMIV